MYLADTSVWIDLFNNKANSFVIEEFKEGKLSLNSLVYFEILQGIKRSKVHQRVKNILLEQGFCGFLDKFDSYEQAAEIYRKCRQNGVTIRSAIDCLIAQCAIENDLILLHNDKDFCEITKIYPLFREQKI